jgi:hypothetical protein
MSVFKIKLEDKAAFLNRMEKAGTELNTNQMVDNKLEGYFEATIRSVKKVWSCLEVQNERKGGLAESTYRVRACYEDINDKSTLQWWVIHYNSLK